MKKKLFTKYAVTAALFLGMASSCNYLDILPPEQTSAEDTMQNKDRMYNFLSSCYHAVLKLNPLAYNNLFASTDEFVNPPLWNEEGQRVAWNQMNGNSVPSAWSDTYSYIGQCHRFLQQLDNLEAQGKLPENATVEDTQICRDEIAFVKAYYHYRMLELFGPIPMMEEMPSQNITNEDIPGRNHYDYCVDYLVTLFDQAVNNLPATRSGDEWGRATSTAAKAIKSRLLLTAASPLWNGGGGEPNKSGFPFPEWKNKELTGNAAHDDVYGTELVSQSYDPNKWKRALDAALDAIQYAESTGKRSLWGLNGGYADGENRSMNFDALAQFALMSEFSVSKNDDIVKKDELEAYGDLTKIYVPYKTDIVKRYVDGDDSNDPTKEEFDEARDFLAHVVTMRMMPHRFESEGYDEIIWGYYQSSTSSRWMTRRNALYPTRVIRNSSNQWRHGWAAWAPTLYTVEHFYTQNGLFPEDDSDWLDGQTYSDDVIFQREGLTEQNREDIVKLHVNREPRFYAWIAYDGDDYAPVMDNGDGPVTLDMNSSNDTDNGLPGQGFSDQYNRDYSATGYLTKKWCPIERIVSETTGDDTGSNYKNYPMPIIRLAELYLNAAECYAALGETDNALNYLNPIRIRAGVPALTKAMIEESGKTILDWVRAERFIELWGESVRYNDLRRTKIAPEQMGANKREGLYVVEYDYDPSFEKFNTRNVIRQNFQWEDRMYILPVANSEVYASKKLIQAPNY